MSVSLVLGNGNLLVNYDEEGFIQDLYWPRVGQENHLQGHHIKIHTWIDGEFNTCDIEKGCWTKHYNYEGGTLVGNISMDHESLQTSIRIKTTVPSNIDALISLIEVENNSDQTKEIRVFFTHDFYIKEHNIGDTCAWYPQLNLLMHYKDDRYLGVGSTHEIYQYDCQKSTHDNGPGVYPDSKTGELKMNPIAQGAVASALSIKFTVNPRTTETFDYFILCGRRYDDIRDQLQMVKTNTTTKLVNQAAAYWHEWLGPKVRSKTEKLVRLEHHGFSKKDVSQLKHLYEQSLLIIRTQIDNGGAIIAANTSKSMQFNRDTYSYMWSADGAYVALALDKAGFSELAEKFYEFCAKIVTKEGFLLHKYTPKGELGSSWHPWVDQKGNPQIPLQADETALPLIAIWEHYKRYKDQEFIGELWGKYIRKAADFLEDYTYAPGDSLTDTTDFRSFPQDRKIKRKNTPLDFDPSFLPKPSYDRWEQRRGVVTSTVAATIAGLRAASSLAKVLGYSDRSKHYANFAQKMNNAFLTHMYDEQEKRFVRMINCDYETDDCFKDYMVDSTLHAVWRFGVLPVHDERVVSTIKQIEEKLWVKSPTGGIARDEDDQYMRQDSNLIGNPWYVTTIWMAQYYIQAGELKQAKRYIDWVLAHADHTGILPEQAHPYRGISLSVKPLTWSHGEFVTMVNFLIEEL